MFDSVLPMLLAWVFSLIAPASAMRLWRADKSLDAADAFKVECIKDLVYDDRNDTDRTRRKLDLYLPKIGRASCRERV